jgi:hypothetical protein
MHKHSRLQVDAAIGVWVEEKRVVLSVGGPWERLCAKPLQGDLIRMSMGRLSMSLSPLSISLRHTHLFANVVVLVDGRLGQFAPVLRNFVVLINER